MNIYSIATKTESISKKCKIETEEEFVPVYQARPGMVLPVIIFKEGKTELVSGMWGLRSTVNANTLHMSRVLKSRTRNLRFRTKRCLIPANCFVTEKNGQAYLIRLPQHRLFLMGGIYQIKRNEIHFTVLMTESADMITSITESMPVLLSCEQTQKWFTRNELSWLMRTADKSGNNWFDYFRVSDEILNAKENRRELLIPTGLSMEQYKLREMQIKAMTFEKERMNRRGGK